MSDGMRSGMILGKDLSVGVFISQMMPPCIQPPCSIRDTDSDTMLMKDLLASENFYKRDLLVRRLVKPSALCVTVCRVSVAQEELKRKRDRELAHLAKQNDEDTGRNAKTVRPHSGCTDQKSSDAQPRVCLSLGPRSQHLANLRWRSPHHEFADLVMPGRNVANRVRSKSLCLGQMQRY